jgi:hypothetical protein
MEGQKNITISLPVGWITFLTLVILKATETISMSWFWVITSVIWAPLAVFVVILLVLGFIALIVAAFGG